MRDRDERQTKMRNRETVRDRDERERDKQTDRQRDW